MANPAVAKLRALKELLYRRIEAKLGVIENAEYEALRDDLLGDPIVAPHLPAFLRQCRDLDDFFPHVRDVVPESKWAARRAYVNEQLGPAFDAAEEARGHASDDDITDALKNLSAASVQTALARALNRRDDPASALTAARTLLEGVCKHVLDDRNVTYARDASLGALYAAAASAVGVHPSDATDEKQRAFLGACRGIATTLGELRNEHGDSHGTGRDAPPPLDQPYGALVVNLAGALGAFLAETHEHAKK